MRWAEYPEINSCVYPVQGIETGSAHTIKASTLGFEDVMPWDLKDTREGTTSQPSLPEISVSVMHCPEATANPEQKKCSTWITSIADKYYATVRSRCPEDHRTFFNSDPGRVQLTAALAPT